MFHCVVLRGLAVVVLSVAAVAGGPSNELRAQGAETLKARHIGVIRSRATPAPRSEGDQAVVDGWPLYRTERGQAVFNEAMATLKATDGPSPSAGAFRGCVDLNCPLTLPEVGADGWLPAGRIWVSPTSYVMIVKSPRQRDFRRRSVMNMQVFVFHEFHNSSRNTDLYDTVSSHSRDVFVPFYMSKQAVDAKGRAFVIVVQVAPADVSSVHASNMGSAGPGIEVAKNSGDALELLQGLAGILIASMVKEHVPRLKVVNHRGSEGAAMLQMYEQRQARLGARAVGPVVLPFTAAAASRITAATGRLEELILRRGGSPRIPVADRGFVPQRSQPLVDVPGPVIAQRGEPKLLEPPTLAARPAGMLDGRTLRPWHRANQRNG